jgi:hypothetical protein
VYLIKDAKISGFKTLNPKPTIPSKYTKRFLSALQLIIIVGSKPERETISFL